MRQDPLAALGANHPDAGIKAASLAADEYPVWRWNTAGTLPPRRLARRRGGSPESLPALVEAIAKGKEPTWKAAATAWFASSSGGNP